jgi:catechol 2,3-dioxygenase-like lactoylglutathione lyase family enzyme
MPRLHHVNLGVPPDVVDAQCEFLTDVLGYRRLDVPSQIAARGALWFEDEQGKQIHLSVDPDHRPPARAHTAIELGDDAARVEARLEATGTAAKVFDGGEVRVVFVEDPAGNRWELRTDPVT